jgi:3-methyl-2-oxobutanoate hydroxymethyltransferase
MGSRVAPETLKEMKGQAEPIAMLTCYDYPTALLQDAVGVDVLLVGDSVGINILGYEGPQQVTMEDMLHHTRAARRGVCKALLLSDLPYGSYDSPEDAVANSMRLVDAGAEAVKLEGDVRVLKSISRIISRGIPVVGHLGHTPQTREGSRRVYGDRASEAISLLEGSLALEKEGAFAIVLECVPERIARMVTDRLSIPTVGIGSGRGCDGQVLVSPDLLGLNDYTFRYSKTYADVSDSVTRAFSAYVSDVKTRQYPGKEHRYLIKTEELRKFEDLLK